MRKRFLLTYLGMVTGFVVLFFLNHSLWLEMRINTALVIPFCTVAGFVSTSFYRKGGHPL